MKLAWLTDIHLNLLSCQNRLEFYKLIVDSEPNAILISGDIANGEKLPEILRQMAIKVQKIPIYFVLGNHDYYSQNFVLRKHNHSDIRYMQEIISLLCKDKSQLKWLSQHYEAQQLDSDTFLVGVDGWADGGYGNYINSSVRIRDSISINDLKKSRLLGKSALLETMQSLAEGDTLALEYDLERLIHLHHSNTKKIKIIILTHIPPFKESCLYEGKPTHDDYLPFFSSKIMGDMLLKIAEKNKDIEFLCLCGHTHSRAYFKPLDNLIVKTGSATYGKPEIQEIIEV